jgi:hypothetical protein
MTSPVVGSQVIGNVTVGSGSNVKIGMFWNPDEEGEQNRLALTLLLRLTILRYGTTATDQVASALASRPPPKLAMEDAAAVSKPQTA